MQTEIPQALVDQIHAQVDSDISEIRQWPAQKATAVKQSGEKIKQS